MNARQQTSNRTGPIDEIRPGGRGDELMDDPPTGEHHRGRFAGYDAGKGVRRKMVAVMGVAFVLSIIAYVQYVDYLRDQRLHPLKDVEALLAPDSPREMTWSSGKARLALAREAPAVEVIHLPDRDIRLADGCDRAQVKLHVRDGETLVVRAIVGEIVQLEPGTMTPLAED